MMVGLTIVAGGYHFAIFCRKVRIGAKILQMNGKPFILRFDKSWGELFMRKMIERELLRLGAPTGRLGYMQLATALELIMFDEQVTSTTQVLYPQVARRCKTKAARIERNIREEIKAIWDLGNQERLDELFASRGVFPPGNKEFLYTLARQLELSCPQFENRKASCH